MNSIDELRTAYRNRYQDYASKFDSLQRMRESNGAEAQAVEFAVVELERARVAYNSARDRLAQCLDRNVDMQAGVEMASAEQHVRATAHLLWELSGRPEGTAESDWKRAETLVLSASR